MVDSNVFYSENTLPHPHSEHEIIVTSMIIRIIYNQLMNMNCNK